jgi:hypothetical protein
VCALLAVIFLTDEMLPFKHKSALLLASLLVSAQAEAGLTCA